MAGLIVNSAHHQSVIAETTIDGLYWDEELAFSVTHTTTIVTTAWNLAAPEGGTADLVESTVDMTTATLRPEKGGAWVVTCLVNAGTANQALYPVTLNVLEVDPSTPVYGRRLVAMDPANALTPTSGHTEFSNVLTGFPAWKDSAGTVHEATTSVTLAAGLATRLALNGTTVPTANIPFGGFKATGLGAPSADTDADTLGARNAALNAAATALITPYLHDSDVSRPSFCELRFQTTATTFNVYVMASLSEFTNQRELAVIVDGVATVYSVPVGASVVAVTGLVDTLKSVILRESPRAWALPGVRIQYVDIASWKLTPTTAPAHRLIVVGDSISCGFLATNPTTEAYSQIIKDAGTYDVTCHAVGGATLQGWASTAAARASTVAQLEVDGTIDTAIWIALGYNDAAAQTPAATWQGWAEDFVDALHTAYPSALIVLASPIVATVETFGAVTLDQYRAAAETVASTRYPWCWHIHGKTRLNLVAGDLVDGVHLGTSGNAKYAAGLLSVLAEIPLAIAVKTELALASHRYWLHPDHGRTVVAGDVTAWTDWMAQGFDCGQSVGSEPVDTTIANGCPAAQMAATGGSFPQGGTNGSATTHTWCAVLQTESTAGYQYLAGSAAGGELTPEVQTSGQRMAVLAQSVGHYPFADGPAVELKLQVMSWVLDGATWTAYVDGIQYGSALTGQTPGVYHPVAIGMDPNGFVGKLVSVAYCDAASTDLVAAFAAWAAARCGIS